MKNLLTSKTSLILLSGAALLVAITGCEEKKAKDEKSEKVVEIIPVTVQKVEKLDFVRENTFYGHVIPSESATLVSFGGGAVKSIAVKAGQSVKKGQNLCNIDGDKFALNVQTSDAALKLAIQDKERNDEHVKNGSGASLLADQSQLGVLQAKQRLVDAQKLNEGAWCISPLSGVVGALHIEKNQNLAAGSPTITLINDSRVKVNFGIPEGNIEGFKEGSRVQVLSLSGKVVEGKIESIDRILDSKDRTFKAELTVNNAGRILKVGEVSQVKAFPLALKNYVVIPTNAITPLAKENIVMVAENGKAKRKVVRIVASNETHSAITGELNAGEELIVQGQNRVQDQTLIKIIPSQGEAKK